MANKNTKIRNRRNHVRTGDAELISSSPRRNMAMRVLRNPGDSRTVHEALDPTRWVDFKNHGYIAKDPTGMYGYKQPSRLNPT